VLVLVYVHVWMPISCIPAFVDMLKGGTFTVNENNSSKRKQECVKLALKSTQAICKASADTSCAIYALTSELQISSCSAVTCHTYARTRRRHNQADVTSFPKEPQRECRRPTQGTGEEWLAKLPWLMNDRHVISHSKGRRKTYARVMAAPCHVSVLTTRCHERVMSPA
jgi:hypothetical protein